MDGLASFYGGQNMDELEEIACRPRQTLPPLNPLNSPYKQHSLLSQKLSSMLQDFQAAIDKNLSEIKVGFEQLESSVTQIAQRHEQQHQNMESLLSLPPHQMPARWWN